MNWELPDVQSGFIKGRGTRDQIAKSVESSKNQGSSRKTSTSALLTMPKALIVWVTGNCGKFFKRWEYQTTLPASGEGNGTPLQCFCQENPMDGRAWWATVHGVTKSWTRLNDFTFTFHFHALEKEMATYSSMLVWRVPGTGAWWAAVYGVTQSRTWLMWLSSSILKSIHPKLWMA